ncbi:MAG: site-specific integrase, partial [Methylocella sp.]
MTRNVPRLIEAFLEMIAAERGASKNTLDAYAHDLADYAAGLARAGKTLQN